MQKIIVVIFALFLIMFVAITIEELFLGGRKKRKLLKEKRMSSGNDPDQSQGGA